MNDLTKAISDVGEKELLLKIAKAVGSYLQHGDDRKEDALKQMVYAYEDWIQRYRNPSSERWSGDD